MGRDGIAISAVNRLCNEKKFDKDEVRNDNEGKRTDFTGGVSAGGDEDEVNRKASKDASGKNYAKISFNRI